MTRPQTVRVAFRSLFVALGALACLAQLPQPAAPRPDNVAAKVLSLQGRVSVLRGSLPWALNAGDAVGQKEVIVTGPDGAALFEVTDGSTFTVYPNSRVTFRNDYSSTNLLELLLGRIKVHIQRWGGQPNNTSISTPTAVISVRGTTFDVVVEDDDSTQVDVQEGEVWVRHALFYNARPRVLKDGDSLRVTRSAPLAKAPVDKGVIFGRAARAGLDAVDTILWRGRAGAGGTPQVPGSRGPVGDTNGGGGGQTPAPPPPDGPPPPPR